MPFKIDTSYFNKRVVCSDQLHFFSPSIDLNFKGPAKTLEYSFFNHHEDRSYDFLVTR